MAVAVDPRSIIEHAQAGDTRAVAALYLTYQPAVHRWVFRRTGGNHHLAEDITSETFLRALRRISGFRWQGRDPGAWLITIARNLLADHYKSGYHKRASLVGDLSCIDEEYLSPDGGDSPEDEAIAAEMRDIIDAALAGLCPAHRECVQLRFRSGFSLAEAAESMGTTVPRLKAVQYRALQSLTRRLDPVWLAEQRT